MVLDGGRDEERHARRYGQPAGPAQVGPGRWTSGGPRPKLMSSYVRTAAVLLQVSVLQGGSDEDQSRRTTRRAQAVRGHRARPGRAARERGTDQVRRRRAVSLRPAPGRRGPGAAVPDRRRARG